MIAVSVWLAWTTSYWLEYVLNHVDKWHPFWLSCGLLFLLLLVQPDWNSLISPGVTTNATRHDDNDDDQPCHILEISHRRYRFVYVPSSVPLRVYVKWHSSTVYFRSNTIYVLRHVAAVCGRGYGAAKQLFNLQCASLPTCLNVQLMGYNLHLRQSLVECEAVYWF